MTIPYIPLLINGEIGWETRQREKEKSIILQKCIRRIK
jgi:hypothetical protein